jgi:tetratricopeptide (TPR) repeat protein
MDDVHVTEGLSPHAQLDAVNRALEASDTDRAIELANQGLEAGLEHPLFLNLSAFGFERAGMLDEALSRLLRAKALAPRDVLILTSIALTLSQQGRNEDALAYFDAALLVHPNHVPAVNGRAASLILLGDLTEGQRQHERAAAMDPNYPDPLGALADLALRDGDVTRARGFAETALALDPQQSAAAMVLAAIEVKDGHHAAALERLNQLLKGSLAPLHLSAALQLKGEILDKLNQPLEAFDAYTEANSIVRRIYGPIYERAEVETGTQLARRLKACVSATASPNWLPAPGADGTETKGHVFLVGFVRSGTTLLEQVLASHPDVVALEEQATLRAITPPYFADQNGLERLMTLNEQEAEGLREEYWTRVRSFGVDPIGKVFVDKAPLSSLWLPALPKLFPNAKVLFAVRDPRDVVISSFRHRFLISALTWPFTNLDATAEFYAAVMSLVETYRDKLDLNFYQHKHEDLVRDFDAEVERICRFLGLDVNPAMREFAETAKRRNVRTPSADQVRRGLFSEGMGRWRGYGPAAHSILPILAPWVARFGYPDDEITAQALSSPPH